MGAQTSQPLFRGVNSHRRCGAKRMIQKSRNNRSATAVTEIKAVNWILIATTALPDFDRLRSMAARQCVLNRLRNAVYKRIGRANANRRKRATKRQKTFLLCKQKS